MKRTILLLLIITTLSCCNKDDDTPIIPIEQLPPATQTGANTVGCLLDGKAFLPGNYNNATNCFYQFVNGEYFFVMAFDNRDNNSNLIGVSIETQKKQIEQGLTYDLLELLDGNIYGGYTFNTFENATSQTHTGKLTITKLDEINNIVSGTFWFDVQDTFGVIHQIREGRFDMQYTN